MSSPRQSTFPDLAHVVIMDSDPAARLSLREGLAQERFRVSEAGTSGTLIAQLNAGGVDLITLDIDLPDMDGVALVKRIDAAGGCPVIIVSARAKTIDKVRCFEAGAIDYMVKPVDSDELAARIRSILRRTQRLEVPGPAGFEEDGAGLRADTVSFEGWTFDIPGQHLESPGHMQVALTGMESMLLAVFVRRPRKLLSRDDIKRALHGKDGDSDIRSIDVLVKKLRAKLAAHDPETEFIKTQRSVGYFFAPKVVAVR